MYGRTEALDDAAQAARERDDRRRAKAKRRSDASIVHARRYLRKVANDEIPAPPKSFTKQLSLFLLEGAL